MTDHATQVDLDLVEQAHAQLDEVLAVNEQLRADLQAVRARCGDCATCHVPTAPRRPACLKCGDHHVMNGNCTRPQYSRST